MAIGWQFAFSSSSSSLSWMEAALVCLSLLHQTSACDLQRRCESNVCLLLSYLAPGIFKSQLWPRTMLIIGGPQLNLIVERKHVKVVSLREANHHLRQQQQQQVGLTHLPSIKEQLLSLMRKLSSNFVAIAKHNLHKSHSTFD